jgi:hypothetical protein
MALAHYLAPNKAPPEHRKTAALIHVAGALAAYIEPSIDLNGAGDAERTGVDKGAWEWLGLSMETVPGIIQDAWIQSFEIFEIVKPSFAAIY